MFHYLVKEDEFLPVKEVDEEGLKALNSEIRRKILQKASEKKVSIEDLTEELNIKQQATYYHVEDMVESGLLEASEGRPRYFEAENTAYYFRPGFVEPEDNPLMLENVPEILRGFVENRKINARIVVGAPYPHGEHNRRHKGAYRAGELSAILGNYGRRREQLIYTDTELNDDLRGRPLISVAGPLVNTLSDEMNGKLPAKFTDSHDKIITEENTYSGDETGLIARTEVNGELRMVVAGLFGLGTSAAIEALASRAEELGENGAVVRGYGTKHSIEEVQIVEKL
jgi:DNA-binding transcriptional ArsR family regulator